MRLPITSKLMPLETPAIFTARLALLNGVERPRTFCQDLGLEWKDIQSGETNALSILSGISGADQNRLIYNSHRPTKIYKNGSANTHIRLHLNHIFHRSFFPLKVFAVCPKCLEEGHGYNIRWKFKGLTSCPHHKVVLYCVDKSVMRSDCETFIAKLAMGKAQIPDEEVKKTRYVSFDRYIEERLEGDTQDVWLDGIPMHAVAHISELLGGVMKYDLKVGMPSRSYWERNELINKGFEKIKNRSEDFCDLIEAFRGERQASGAYKLGSLYRMLYSRNKDVDYRVFLELTNRQIQSTTFITEFDYVFGEPIEVPNAISLHKLAIQCQMNKYTLIEFIRNNPDLKCEVQSGRVSLKDGRKILDRLPKAISKTHAAELMGISTDLLTELISRRIIVFPAPDGVEKLAISPVCIDEFMASLYEKARKSEPPKSTKTIYEISTKIRVKICDIIEEIQNLRYNIFWFGQKQRKLLDIMLIEDDVRHHFLGPEPDGLTFERSANFLSVHIYSIEELISKKILVGKICYSNLRRQKQRYINQNRLKEFSRVYVSLAEAAEILGVSRQKLKCDFGQMGLEPALIGSNYTFFIREEIQQKIRNCP